MSISVNNLIIGYGSALLSPCNAARIYCNEILIDFFIAKNKAIYFESTYYKNAY